MTTPNANIGNALRPAGARCGACQVRSLCLAEGLGDGDVARLERVVSRRRRVPRDEALFRMGDAGGRLYLVRYGHFKSVQTDQRGVQHVTGFPMAGELLGLDALGTGVHAGAAIALEDSEACEIELARLQCLLAEMPRLLAQFHRALGREILREQAAMVFLGNIRADQRLASFLLDLGERYAQRGYSSRSFQLRMSREDIGGYLGLTIECVSRQLSRFREQGWIALDRRAVELLDPAALAAIAAGVRPTLEGAGAARARAA